MLSIQKSGQNAILNGIAMLIRHQELIELHLWVTGEVHFSLRRLISNKKSTYPKE